MREASAVGGVGRGGGGVGGVGRGCGSVSRVDWGSGCVGRGQRSAVADASRVTAGDGWAGDYTSVGGGQAGGEYYELEHGG